MSENRPKPIAQGYLSDTPFQHLLLYLAQHGHNGTLILMRSAEEGESRILFRDGRPVAARFPKQVGLKRGLLPICSWPEASFAFFPADLVGRGMGVTKGNLDPVALVSASLSEHTRDGLVEAVLQRLGSGRLVPQPGLDYDGLSLAEAELALLEQLRRAPATVDELVDAASDDRVMTRRRIYFLIITRLATTERAAREIMEHKARARAEEERQRQSSASVPVAATGSDPAAVASPSHEPPATPAAGTARSLPAWKRLASMRPQTTRSGAPVIAFKSSGPIPEHVVSFKEAERLTKAGRLGEALAAIQKSLKEADDIAQYHAQHAHILFLASSDPNESRDIRDAIKRALELDEDEATALYVKGLLYKQAGKMREAKHYFMRTIQARPTHLEAKRELRLFKLRRDTL